MLHPETGATQEVQPDLIIGADGAFSAVRSALQKSDRFNYSQYYIPYGYKELSIEPTQTGGFRMEPNALHIWPRKQYMLIALPNANGSFTCTLFLDFEGETSFASLQTKEAVKEFFETSFPDLIPLIPDYAEQFFANPTASLVTVRCNPWNRGRVMLIGDAAHAIVPFYGQGMNAGFEDCTVLMRLLDQYQDNWTLTREAFQQERIPDANAIADLALRNFVEMRDLVADPDFQLRKRIEARLHEAMPDKWLPLYSMVTFTDMPYSTALKLGQQQDVIMEKVLKRPDIGQWESEGIFRQITAQVEKMLEG
jgi:kynurenine 3-monooxygenase